MAGNSQQQERMARLPEAAEFINQPHLRNELRDIVIGHGSRFRHSPKADI
jgi:hypothetical protein